MSGYDDRPTLVDTGQFAASGGRGGPWRLAEPLYAVTCGQDASARFFWYDNAVVQARRWAREYGKAAWIRHPHTDLDLAVCPDMSTRGSLSAYFDPKPVTP